MIQQASPTPILTRSQLLRRIREAELPCDAKQFNLDELESAGFCKLKRAGLDTNNYKLLTLLDSQTKELKKECKRFRDELELQKKYHSPLWDKAGDELCPIKALAFGQLAQEDEQRVGEKRRKSDPFTRFMESFQNEPVREWKSRDKRRSLSRIQPVLWHEPMTLKDYHNATGLSRATVRNILRRAGARSIPGPRRRNEPERYDSEANAAVLCGWLTRHVKNIDHRKSLITRTLLHCEHNSPDQLGVLFEAITPAYESLHINPDEFENYFSECKKILYPSQTSALGLGYFSSILKYSSHNDLPD